jgi:hypothetical protein
MSLIIRQYIFFTLRIFINHKRLQTNTHNALKSKRKKTLKTKWQKSRVEPEGERLACEA